MSKYPKPKYPASNGQSHGTNKPLQSMFGQGIPITNALSRKTESVVDNTASEDPSMVAAESAEESARFLQKELEQKQQELMGLQPDCDPLLRAKLQLENAEIMIGIGTLNTGAWGLAREAFDLYVQGEQWEDAVRCCDVLYQAEQPASLAALGNGLWLAVTYPIDPELTIVILNYLVDDTPPDSDGAAVAAATAHYIADLRYEGEKRESTMFLTSTLLGKVAGRHSQVQTQEQMNAWMMRLELFDHKIFLPRLGIVLDAIVGDQWWYDRDELRSRLPVN